MTIARLLTQTATVLTMPTSTRDVRGNTIIDWAGATATDYPARLEQANESETGYDRYTEVADFRLFLPPDAVIDGRDRVRVETVTYEVIGPPEKQRTPRGVHHIEARLRRVES